jgi:hypothetical protein
MRVRQGGADWHRHERAHRPGHAHAEVAGVLVLALTSVPRERAALLREEAATSQARGSASKRSRAKAGGGAYKSAGIRIARSDVGNRPSSRFPTRYLQRSGSCASLLRQVAKIHGRAAVGAHRFVSALSAEIAGGTVPEKRFSPRYLCRSVPIQHARVGRETARAVTRRTAKPAW